MVPLFFFAQRFKVVIFELGVALGPCDALGKSTTLVVSLLGGLFWAAIARPGSVSRC